MDCDRILANLYIGSHPNQFEDIDQLEAIGVTTVLNLQSDDDFRRHRIDWHKLVTRYDALSFDVHRIPIRDFDNDDLLDNLPHAVRLLRESLETHTVFVHCTAGLNRAPSIVIAYLHWVQQWSLNKAARFVQRRHPCLPAMDTIRGATLSGAFVATQFE
jgi:hypothetical protein